MPQLNKHCLAPVLFGCLALFAVSATAQQRTDSLFLKLTTLREVYILKMKNNGFNTSLPAPRIVMDNPASFGMYDDSSNIIHTGDWKTLPGSAKAFFTKVADGFRESGESYFEKSVHQWIFIHELSHWWRSSQKLSGKNSYQSEKAANRLAVAFWREYDPAFYAYKLNTFKSYLTHLPCPVPAGKDKERFFNDQYGKLPGATSYTWFQADMILDIANETPVLSFKEEALAQVKTASLL